MSNRTVVIGGWSGIGLALLAAGCFSPEGGVDGATDTDVGSSSGTLGTTSAGSTAEAGTTGDTTDSPTTVADSSTGPAVSGEVRAVHAALGAGAVDIYLAGEATPAFAGLEFTDASDWLDVPTGTWTFEFRPAGAPSDSEPVYLSEPVTVTDDTRATAIASGELGSEDEAAAFRLVLLEEDWGAALAGRARGRVVHVGPDAPTLGFEGIELEETVARFGSSDPEGFGIEADGVTRLELLDSESRDAELTSFSVQPIAEGDEVLLVATGRLGSLARGPDGFVVIAVGRDGSLGVVRQDPELFVLHGSNDAGALEACFGEFELAANLAYGDLQSTRVWPGDYDIGIYDYPSGCNGTALNTSGSGPLEAGGRYLVLLTGEVTPDAGEAGLQVETLEDTFTVDDEPDARLKFVHGASFSQIYVGSVVDDQIVDINVYTDAISWTDESDEVTLMPAQYEFGIADAFGKPAPPYVPLATASLTIGAGARQWVIVAGDPLPEAGDGGPLALVVDTTAAQWTVASQPLVPLSPP
ncbi:MAG: DUF4397 domain-containing protein [Nannocystales bacterium]